MSWNEMLTVNVLQTDSNTNLIGPFDDNYKKTDTFSIDSTVWSPCGYDGMLNINSEVRINPLVSPNPALMTVSFAIRIGSHGNPEHFANHDTHN